MLLHHRACTTEKTGGDMHAQDSDRWEGAAEWLPVVCRHAAQVVQKSRMELKGISNPKTKAQSVR